MRCLPMLAAATLLAAAPAQDRGPLPALALRDAQGQEHTVFPAREGITTALLFLAPGCPIAESYSPTLAELAARHRDGPVRWLAVYATDLPPARIAEHHRAHALPFPALLDPERRAARMLGATTTPQVFVIDAAGQVRYAGRIDDRWTSRTSKRDDARTHDLADALDAVLYGREVPAPRTRAFGCAIQDRRGAAPTNSALTYHRDIAPLLQRRCQECHREGQVAPFALECYSDAASWGEEIVELTQGGLMPPWRAAGPHGVFAGDRRLTEDEKRTLREWVEAGMPEGDAGDAPPAAVWPAGWKLGPPDLVLELPEPYEVAAAGRDEYVCFVIPTGLTEAAYLKAAEFQPGNRRVVHHVIGYLDTDGRGRALDAQDPRPGYRRFGGPGFLPAGGIGGWAPGNEAQPLPPGVARLVPAGADLVLQMHYTKTGKAEVDRTRVGLYFAKEPITHHLIPWAAASFALSIPAGETRHVVRDERRLPFAMDVLGLMPHMHLLGRKIALTAELPDGSVQELIRVDDWDFDWQLTYWYARPRSLPAGTVLHLEAEYDNSVHNPRNPHDPPRRVHWGERTSDEMCFVFLFATSPEHPKMDWSALRRFALGALQLPAGLLRGRRNAGG